MKQGFTSGLVLLGFILIQIQVAGCINCLNCKNIEDLSQCQDVVPCNDNEVCYIEKFLSTENFQALYNTGCRSMQLCTLQYCNKKEYGDGNSRKKRQSGEALTLCSDCCFEDSCNTEGCGYFPHLKNISQCYSCDGVTEDGPPCVKTEDCDLKLFSCSVSISEGNPKAYDLGCKYKRKQCEYLLTLNQTTHNENVKCCDQPLCNKNPFHKKINKTAVAMNFTCPAGIARPTSTPSRATTAVPVTKQPTTNATTKATFSSTTSVPTTTTQVTTSVPTKTTQVTTPVSTTTTQVTTPVPTTSTQVTTPVPTTTTQVTTPVPTTPAAKSTEPPLKTLPPVTTTCAVCSGPKFLCEKLFASTPCPPPNNYCINTIQNHKDGTKTVDRACGNFDTCYREWFLGSSDKDKCSRFKGNIEQRLDFQCTFCCITDNCNIPLHPDINTLYQPS